MSKAETCVCCGAIIPEGSQVCPKCRNEFKSAPLLVPGGKIMNINQLVTEIHENAVAHGWWDEERSFGDIIAPCHSELSEALEEYRDRKPPVYFNCDRYQYHTCEPKNDNEDYCGSEYEYPCDCCNNKPEGTAVELIDCVIRIFDYLGKTGVDVEKILVAKHEYNKTRPYRHGWKVI